MRLSETVVELAVPLTSFPSPGGNNEEDAPDLRRAARLRGAGVRAVSWSRWATAADDRCELERLCAGTDSDRSGEQLRDELRHLVDVLFVHAACSAAELRGESLHPRPADQPGGPVAL